MINDIKQDMYEKKRYLDKRLFYSLKKVPPFLSGHTYGEGKRDIDHDTRIRFKTHENIEHRLRNTIFRSIINQDIYEKLIHDK